MKRLLTLLCVALFATVFVGGLCGGNKPPEPPTVTGPETAGKNDTLTFRVAALDPEGGNLQYRVDFGDGTTPEWTTASYPDELPVSFKHAYPETGSYAVKAMARDEEGLESEWSAPHQVTIEQWSPIDPPPPDGPTACTTGIPHFFTATTTHPQGESLWFQFDWGDTFGNWSGPVASGGSYAGVKTWNAEGGYAVRVRARDKDERTSGWSAAIQVQVIRPTGGAPTNFRLRAAGGGLTVQLTWSPPGAGTPAEYAVHFRDQGGFQVVARPATALYVHDPAGRTGDYLVAARFDTTWYFAPETLTTRPVYTAELVIYELNGSGNQGYGWTVGTGLAASYDMRDAGNAPGVDLCCTDFNTGHGGPFYTVASPDETPRDPGGAVPPGNWRQSRFAYLTGGQQDPLPAYSQTTYHEYLDIGQLPLALAAYTAEKHFSLVLVNDFDTGTGQIRLESWFQRVPELRLIAH